MGLGRYLAGAILPPVFLLLTVAARAGDLYRIHHLSEQEVVQTYVLMLQDSCRFASNDWKVVPFDPAAGYWGDGVSGGNAGIRTIVSMALACAALVKYDDALPGGERQAYLAQAMGGLRFVTATHITGPQKCTDGRHWGATEKPGPQNWQSGMWTGTLGATALLLWDRMDPALQKEVERVIAWEDDILTKGNPPTGLWLDTKAEENGWNVPPLVLGEVLFPKNPHAAAWHEKAEEYMMNTLCTSNDLRDTTVVDGKPVNQWVRGANLQPDFTLENHNIFHPSYVGCSSYFLTEAALFYTYAGRPVPEAASHHLLDTWRMFQAVILPWGESAYPQGMDWELHGLPFFNLFAALATQRQDLVAARLENINLQYFRAWQVMRHGDFSIPGSRFGMTRHAINAEQASYGLMAHKVFGPAARGLMSSQYEKREDGVLEHPYVDFIAQRTPEKFVSFSWKNKIMGQIIPLGDDHEDNPDFTVPIPNGLVGSFDLAGKGGGKMTVVEHFWKKIDHGFETTGAVLLNGGRLKQTMCITSVGSRAVVYQDHVIAMTDVTVRGERGVPVGIENDEITGGQRVLTDAEGQTILDWKKPQKSIALRGSWGNVDGRLAVVAAFGHSLACVPGTGYAPGISVCADILYAEYSDHERQFKKGDEVANRIVLFCTEITPEETAELKESFVISGPPGGQILSFKPPHGSKEEVPLF